MSSGFDSVFPGKKSRTYVMKKVVGDNPFVDFSDKLLINVGYPTAPADAANKQYVDDQIVANSPWVATSTVPPVIEPAPSLTDANVICGSLNCEIVEATEFITPSDIKVKENVEELDGDEILKRLGTLRGIRYRSTIDSKDHLGLIAQELNEVFPEVVAQKKTEDDILRVRYIEIIPLLLESIKNINTRLTSLENLVTDKLKKLEDKIDKLQGSNAKLMV